MRGCLLVGRERKGGVDASRGAPSPATTCLGKRSSNHLGGPDEAESLRRKRHGVKVAQKQPSLQAP